MKAVGIASYVHHGYYSIWFIFRNNFYIIGQKTKKWEITLLNYFHEYAILLHPNFSVLTVDRSSPLSMKRGGGSTISDK
jgi:hypothetical protein